MTWRRRIAPLAPPAPCRPAVAGDARAAPPPRGVVGRAAGVVARHAHRGRRRHPRLRGRGAHRQRLDVGRVPRPRAGDGSGRGDQGVQHRRRRAQLRPPALRLGGPGRRAGVRAAQPARGAQLGSDRGRPAVPRHQAVRAGHAAPPGAARRSAVTRRGRLGGPAAGHGAGDAAPAQHPPRRRQAGERVHRRRRLDGARRPRVGVAARRRRAGGDDDARRTPRRRCGSATPRPWPRTSTRSG